MFRTLRPSQIVVDLVLAGLYALLLVPIEISSGSPTSGGAVGAVGATLGFTVALAIRRLSPGYALVLAWLAAILQMATLNGPRPSDVAIFAVLYVTAAYGSRAVFWAGFASTILGAVVITVYLFVALNGLTLESLPVALAILVAAGFALGLAWVTGALVRVALRGAEARRARAAAEAEAATEQERVRIARDMHDVVAHSLAVVIAQADGARYAAASDPGAATAALATISATARSALGDVRLLLTQLRHSQGDGPQPSLTDVEGLYAQVRAAGVDLRVDVDPAPTAEPPASVQLAAYRILQEALTNALRHGRGGAVTVALAWRPDHVEVVVQNPADAAAAPAPGGHGLIGMRERAQLAGGTLDAGPDAGSWRVRAVLPLARALESTVPTPADRATARSREEAEA